ncbi:helix-turn-helix domain-containing protein, partial [Streptomyces sp. NPDC006207]
MTPDQIPRGPVAQQRDPFWSQTRTPGRSPALRSEGRSPDTAACRRPGEGRSPELPAARAFAHNGFSISASAAVLHLHPNTVSYRLD